MSKADKLRAMEAIWADLTADERDFESPTWHAEELRETEQIGQAGQSQISGLGRGQEDDSQKSVVRIRILDIAAADLIGGSRFYDRQTPGVGGCCADEGSGRGEKRESFD